ERVGAEGQFAGTVSEVVTQEPRRRRSLLRHSDELRVSVDASHAIAGPRELGRHAARSRAELEHARSRRYAELGEARQDDVVSRAVPEVVLLREEQRTDVGFVRNVEVRVALAKFCHFGHALLSSRPSRAWQEDPDPWPYRQNHTWFAGWSRIVRVGHPGPV